MSALFAILQLLPMIMNAIVTIENAFPGAKGSDKKSLLMGALAPVVSTAHGAKQAGDTILPALSQTVDGLVGALNASNLWPKGAEQLAKAHSALNVAGQVLSAVDTAAQSINTPSAGE